MLMVGLNRCVCLCACAVHDHSYTSKCTSVCVCVCVRVWACHGSRSRTEREEKRERQRQRPGEDLLGIQEGEIGPVTSLSHTKHSNQSRSRAKITAVLKEADSSAAFSLLRLGITVCNGYVSMSLIYISKIL